MAADAYEMRKLARAVRHLEEVAAKAEEVARELCAATDGASRVCYNHTLGWVHGLVFEAYRDLERAAAKLRAKARELREELRRHIEEQVVEERLRQLLAEAEA